MPSLGPPMFSSEDDYCFGSAYEIVTPTGSSFHNNNPNINKNNSTTQPPPPPPPRPPNNYQNYTPSNLGNYKKKKLGKSDWTDYLALISLKFCTQDQSRRLGDYNDNDIKIILEKQLDYTRTSLSLQLSKCKTYPEKPEGAHRTMLIDFGSEHLKNKYWDKISPGTQFKNTKRDDNSQYVEVVTLLDLMYDSKKRTECVRAMGGMKVPQSTNLTQPEQVHQSGNQIDNVALPQYLPPPTTFSSPAASSSPPPLDPLTNEMNTYAERFENLKRKREAYEQDIISKVRHAIEEMYKPKAKKDDVTFVDDNDDDLGVKIH
ncbi:hypothetical protein C9374_003156 [Naegleria lovaniensis]|uniref:Uncharacterized protein n=1 Tax=Naegleria lovaniensis TaxID=51637 RepID=A0AA88KQ34_NAELO|nr:uncharacterized protein C9374_003156 [Naegleria lovaniensis]KAG2386007.1 hypothetical protein C9374_003156 [Naegleria lovaniensis]